LQNDDLVSGYGDGTIEIWNLSTWELKRNLTGHSCLVRSLAVMQNGDLASGSADKTIKIWDTSSGSLVRNLTGHSDWILSLTVLHNGDLASSSHDRNGLNDYTIKIWNFSS
jgi:WD40 repeat protein